MQALRNTPDDRQDRQRRDSLRCQREELINYLEILNRLAAAVAGGETERIRHYIGLEGASIARLTRLEKLRPASPAPPGSSDEDLRASLESLSREALRRNAAVRSALAAGMAELRLLIENRKRGSAHLPSPYAGIARPSLVDIHS